MQSRRSIGVWGPALLCGPLVGTTSCSGTVIDSSGDGAPTSSPSGGSGGSVRVTSPGGSNATGGTASETGGASADGGASANGGTFTTGGQPPSAGVCDPVLASVEPVPVDMYIMLDKSSSMADAFAEAPSKWEATVTAIQAFVTAPRAQGIGVGIQFFGLPDACNADVYAVPAVPIGRIPAVAQDIATAVASEAPETLTPTAPALEGALRYMQAWRVSNPERTAAVALVTDGFPTQCGVSCATGADCQGGTCTDGMCDPNFLLDIQAVAERYATADPPVLTFIIAVGEALVNFDGVARAGGTGGTWLVDGGDVQSQVLDALLGVAETPLGCTFFVPESSDPTVTLDPASVSLVYRSTDTQASVEIVKLAAGSQCPVNGGEGWYYDYDPDPTRIFLCPETCRQLTAGTVSLAIGCPPGPFPFK